MSSYSIVDFYKENKITPIRQNIEDLEKHFQRRESLYRHCGILPLFVKGKRVVEIGPGAGHNSLYTASLEPDEYVLIEGNPTGVETVRTLFSNFPEWEKRISIQNMMVEDFPEDRKFDLVLCEGVLSGVPDTETTLRAVAKLVTPNGVLLMTCIDEISYFPDSVRRLFAQLIINPHDSLDEQVKQLMPVFSPQLSTLKAMSRRHDDWIIDNLINPASIFRLISIPGAIDVLKNEFDFYASSQHFVTDWRWYKEIVGKDRQFNKLAVEQYHQNAHNFLDYRRVMSPISPSLNHQLFKLCRSFRDELRAFEKKRTPAALQKVKTVFRRIIQHVKKISPELSAAFQEAYDIIHRSPLDTKAFAKSKKFGPLFARGQQYVTFTRKKS